MIQIKEENWPEVPIFTEKTVKLKAGAPHLVRDQTFEEDLQALVKKWGRAGRYEPYVKYMMDSLVTLRIISLFIGRHQRNWGN